MADPRSNSLEITVDQAGDAATVRVRGEVDIESSQQLTTALVEAGTEARHVEVDLSDVTYMDSSGLRALLSAKTTIEADARTLVVSDTSRIVARLFEITGVTPILTPED